MNYQFIVIFVNPERKKFMEKQFTKLSQQCKIIFIEGFTPLNSEDYLFDIEDETDKRRTVLVNN